MEVKRKRKTKKKEDGKVKLKEIKGNEKRKGNKKSKKDRKNVRNESHQKKTGYRPVNIAIVDAGGDLVLFRRQNNAYLLSIDIAIKKANSSAGIPVPTRVIEELVYGKDKTGGVIPGLAFSKDLVGIEKNRLTSWDKY